VDDVPEAHRVGGDGYAVTLGRARGYAVTAAATLRRVMRYLDDDAVKLQEVDVVFDGPPGPTSGAFVEVENLDGASVSVGQWLDRGDGFHALRLMVATPHGD
jgi:hypothetical protein